MKIGPAYEPGACFLLTNWGCVLCLSCSCVDKQTDTGRILRPWQRWQCVAIGEMLFAV